MPREATAPIATNQQESNGTDEGVSFRQSGRLSDTRGNGRVALQVSSRGQITIDRAARKALNVKPGMVAVQVAVDGRLEVYFIPAPHRRSLFGVLPPKETVSIDDWDAIRLRAAQAIAQDA